MLGAHCHSYPNTAASIDRHRGDMNLDDANVHLLYRFFAIFVNHLNRSTMDEEIYDIYFICTTVHNHLLTGSSPNVYISHKVTANIHESEA